MDHGREDCTEDAITLLVACYMHIDIEKYWSQILEILDYGGKMNCICYIKISDNLFYLELTSINLEMKFQALLAGGKDARSLTNSVVKYLAIKHKESSDDVKRAANQVIIIYFTLFFSQFDPLLFFL